MRIFHILAFTLATIAIPFGAKAADLAPLKAPARSVSACTLQSCSGWYVGADVTGVGSNVDIIGQGVAGSVFAGGGIVGVHGGYQLWNGRFFAAAEAGIGLESARGPATAAIGGNRIVGTELVKLGIGLSGLFGSVATEPATASQSPVAISVPSSLSEALLSPYVVFGAMQRGRNSVWVNGAGAEFLLSAGVNLSLEYLYAPPMNTEPATQLVRLGLNRKF